ncbi:MAG: hypothetical protein JW728_03325 [Candidatus Aureabacteria bacterium]|nr:hypothetical protein [Candidatus Auribacterota bacterium]
MNKRRCFLLAYFTLAIILICSVLWLVNIDFFFFPGKKAEGWSALERSSQWFIAQQRANRNWLVFHNGLVPSHEGGSSAFTYDQALAVMVFTLHGDYGRAGLLLGFFQKTYDEQLLKYGRFIGFCDAYSKAGAWEETWAAGPNAWILLAINHYTYVTGDMQYLALAEAVAKWLISLQSFEGGIIGGYYGDGSPMTWMATEHNFDCYAALRDLGILTGNDKYLKSAKDIKSWLENDPWDGKTGRFYMGRKKYNPNYATDLSSWAVLSLGRQYSGTLDFAIEKSLNRQLYKVNNVEIEGFDFGSSYESSPFPDKDAVWLEGTGQMVLAFDKADREEEKNKYLKEIEKALTPSAVHKYTAALPYATNEGTPAYGSWMMQDRPLCVSSTAWYIFAKEGFNPFSMDQKDDANNKKICEIDYNPRYYFMPVVDDFEETEVKFENAYLKELILGSNAEIKRHLSANEKLSGDSCMELILTPGKNAKLASGIVSRPFLYPQDWSGYSGLVFSVYTDDPGIIIKLKIKDREGEPFESYPMSVREGEKNTFVIDIKKDFSRSDAFSSYGNKIMDADGIREFSLEIMTKRTDSEKKIYIDNITLENK